MIAFMTVNLVLQFLIASLALFLKYGVKISYNVVGVTPRDWHFWSKPRVAVVYLSSPLFLLLAGLILFNYLRINKEWANRYRMFAFWLMMCLINLTLSHLFFSPLGIRGDGGAGYYQTYAIVATWMNLTAPVMSVFAALSIIASLWLGVACRNQILKFSYSSKLNRSTLGKSWVILQLYILPVLLGAVPLLFLCSKINVFPTVFMCINLLIIGVGMLARNFNDTQIVRCYKYDSLNHFPLVEFLFVAVMWLVIFRFFAEIPVVAAT